MQERLARRQVVTQTAIAYLNSLSADRSVEAAQANLELALSLVRLARDQRNAGVATGVDVTRAETRSAEEQVRLAQAQTNAQEARLALLRDVGLPLSSIVNLTDSLRFVPEAPPAPDPVVKEAEQNRLEVQIAAEQVRLNAYLRRAAEAELLPSLEVAAESAVSSSSLSHRHCVELRSVWAC